MSPAPPAPPLPDDDDDDDELLEDDAEPPAPPLLLLDDVTPPLDAVVPSPDEQAAQSARAESRPSFLIDRRYQRRGDA